MINKPNARNKPNRGLYSNATVTGRSESALKARLQMQKESVSQILLSHAFQCQFSRHIVQVLWVWVAVAGDVGAKLRLVVDFIPGDSVRLTGSGGLADGEHEFSPEGHHQQFENLEQRAKQLGGWYQY